MHVGALPLPPGLSHQHLPPPLPRVMPPPSTSLSLSVPHLDVNNLKTYAKRGVSMPYLGPCAVQNEKSVLVVFVAGIVSDTQHLAWAGSRCPGTAVSERHKGRADAHALLMRGPLATIRMQYPPCMSVLTLQRGTQPPSQKPRMVGSQLV